MDIDYHYEHLREKLDTLGFNQPLPIGALGIVTSLLDDLIKTTNSLKNNKELLEKLLQEKEAWDLKVEPYKCDNAKLLAECNALHLEYNKQHDKHLHKICELKKIIYNLEADKQYLEEHCSELDNRLRHIELNSKSSHNKDDCGGVGMLIKKPFISTVRSDYRIPNPMDIAMQQNHHQSSLQQQQSQKCSKCIKCACFSGGSVNYQQMPRTQIDEKVYKDKLDALTKQINERDREVQRLTKLLIGGRPPSALAKDCCYKGIGNLTEDVEHLQKEKIQLQNKLQEIVQNKHEAMERAMQLSERVQQLQKQLKDIDSTALSMESEANNKIKDKEVHCNELKVKLTKAKNKINDLKNIIMNLKEKLRNDESKKSSGNDQKAINEQLNKYNAQIQDLQKLNEKLQRKNTKLVLLHQKSADEEIQLNMKLNKKLEMKNASTDPLVINTKINNSEFEQLKYDYDNIQKEYLNVLKMCTNKDGELNKLKNKLNDKQIELETVKYQLRSKSSVIDDCGGGGASGSGGSLSNRSVQSTICRIERERDLIKCDLDRLIIERNELRNKIQMLTESQLNEKLRNDKQYHEYLEKITELEHSNRQLTLAQIPQETKINILRKELDDARQSYSNLDGEYRNLKTTHSQLKILQEQSERALTEHQNRLLLTENQLGHASSKINTLDSNRDEYFKEMAALKGDIVLLKATNNSLEMDKDKLILQLDNKTESLFNLEADYEKLKQKHKDLDSKCLQLRKKLEDATNQNRGKDDAFSDIANETETLRKQISQLKRANDNVLSENRRHINEITELKSDESMKLKKLKELEKEVERLKQQLQQYVQEVQRAENLLLKKQEEREEMLEHYRSLSHDAIILEGNNHSLELETAATKQNLLDAECRINDLQNQMESRDNQITCLDNQIIELTKHVQSLELEVDTFKSEKCKLQTDLDAIKNLCNKLDVEKIKLNAELNECNDIRRKLERDNEKLRCSIDVTKKLGISGNKIAMDSLQELLTVSRQELDQQKVTVNKLNAEIKHLINKIEELEMKLSEEHLNVERQEALAKEYSIQIHELQHKLTDERFIKLQSKDDCDSFLNMKNIPLIKNEDDQFMDYTNNTANLPFDNEKLLNTTIKLSDSTSNEYQSKLFSISQDDNSTDSQHNSVKYELPRLRKVKKWSNNRKNSMESNEIHSNSSSSSSIDEYYTSLSSAGQKESHKLSVKRNILSDSKKPNFNYDTSYLEPPPIYYYDGEPPVKNVKINLIANNAILRRYHINLRNH